MDFSQLESLLNQAIAVADKLLPSGAITSKKAVAVGYLVAQVEKTDDLAPGLFGEFMDLPVVDRLEYEVIESAVDWVWAKLKLEANP